MYPFGYISEIQQNSAHLLFGISYGVDNYYWQNITVFDSKCRSCQNGILDADLVKGTCIADKSKTCSFKNVSGCLFLN